MTFANESERDRVLEESLKAEMFGITFVASACEPRLDHSQNSGSNVQKTSYPKSIPSSEYIHHRILANRQTNNQHQYEFSEFANAYPKHQGFGVQGARTSQSLNYTEQNILRYGYDNVSHSNNNYSRLNSNNWNRQRINAGDYVSNSQFSASRNPTSFDAINSNYSNYNTLDNISPRNSFPFVINSTKQLGIPNVSVDHNKINISSRNISEFQERRARNFGGMKIHSFGGNSGSNATSINYPSQTVFEKLHHHHDYQVYEQEENAIGSLHIEFDKLFN